MQEETEAESTDTPSADASQDVKTEVETEEVKTEETTEETTTDESKDEPDGEKTPPKPKKTKGQKRIAELSYENREARRTNDRLLKLLETQQSKGAPKEPPKIEDFETIDEYLDARDSHRDQKSSKPEKADDSKDYSAEQEEYTREAIDELRIAGSEKYEDFDDVVFAEGAKITPVMRDALLVVDDHELQAEIAYFLGSNSKEAARISKLSPLRQVTEIGKLEAKIASKPAPKRPSAAPKPITPVGGAKTSSDTHQTSDDMATFLKKRNKELGRG